MLIVILALLALVGCGDTVENYYSVSQPVDAAATTPDAAPDTAVDATEPDTSKPDTYAPPDVAVDTWTQPDTYVDTAQPDTYVAPIDSGPKPIAECNQGRYQILEYSSDCKTADDGSGLFIDSGAKLMWMMRPHIIDGVKQSDGGIKYPSALEYAAYCEAKDWRLPTLSELIENKGSCAWACKWTSWSMTKGPGAKYYAVMSSGAYAECGPGPDAHGLCVKDL